MGLIKTIVIAALGRLLADEISAWEPLLTRRLIRLAARQLPRDLRERYREEWSSHVQDVPGEAGKVLIAAQFVLAAIRISTSRQSERLAGLGINRVCTQLVIPCAGVAHKVSTWMFSRHMRRIYPGFAGVKFVSAKYSKVEEWPLRLLQAHTSGAIHAWRQTLNEACNYRDKTRRIRHESKQHPLGLWANYSRILWSAGGRPLPPSRWERW